MPRDMSPFMSMAGCMDLNDPFAGCADSQDNAPLNPADHVAITKAAAYTDTAPDACFISRHFNTPPTARDDMSCSASTAAPAEPPVVLVAALESPECQEDNAMQSSRSRSSSPSSYSRCHGASHKGQAGKTADEAAAAAGPTPVPPQLTMSEAM